jgi:hypothetical protein
MAFKNAIIESGGQILLSWYQSIGGIYTLGAAAMMGLGVAPAF